MPKITKLERQKHNKNRVSVFVDDDYAFSVSDELIIEYKIALNMDVTLLPLNEIMEEDNYKTCLAVAFKHIAISDKSKKQLYDHLIKKAFPVESVERVIARLKELNYIDDLALAKTFVEHSSKSGIMALTAKLQQKGIASEIIEMALENESDELQEEKALNLAKKQMYKYNKLSNYEQKQKLNAFLFRHGFVGEVRCAVIEKLIKED